MAGVDDKDTVVVPREPADKASVPQDDEAKYKAYVREKYGIEDDPDTFKTKRKAEQEAAEHLPKYREAVTQLWGQLQGQQFTPVPAEPEPRKGVTSEPDESQLEQYARYNPLGAYKYLQAKDKAEQDQRETERLKAVAQMIIGAQSQQKIRDEATAHLKAEYPEAYDQQSELHQVGRQVFWREFSDDDRAKPAAFRYATEIAAARLGLPPKSKRTASSGSAGEDSDAQNVGRGGKRPPAEDAEVARFRPNQAESKMIEAMGLDVKMLAQAKAARKQGKNLRFE